MELVKGAFEDALARTSRAPYLFHSDQGGQYQATEYLFLLQQRGILVSMSEKGSPWQNPHQESYYSYFKLDLGDPNRFETLGELVTEIHWLIFRYNNLKIYSTLKCPPTVFRERLLQKRSSQKLVQTV
jgi:transposase InsO family protein